MSTIKSDCVMHGEDQLYVWSAICNGFICVECIKENLFIEDVEKEVLWSDPKLFVEVEERQHIKDDYEYISK